MERSSTPSANAPESVPESRPASGPAPVPDRTLEISMPWLGRTIRQIRATLAQMAPGQVLAVHTDDP